LGDAFTQGKQAPVPFLSGANSFEASLMSVFGISSENIMTRAAGNGPMIKRLYGDDPQKAARTLFTDAVFLGPACYLASQIFGNREK
jgi:hypothetical protein